MSVRFRDASETRKTHAPRVFSTLSFFAARRSIRAGIVKQRTCTVCDHEIGFVDTYRCDLTAWNNVGFHNSRSQSISAN